MIVARGANFGNFEFLNLFVDGVQVAKLGFLRSYEAVLPPGPHVLSVTPQLGHDTYTIVNAKPGRTYAFTAFWKNTDQAYLEKSNGGPKRVITPSNPG